MSSVKKISVSKFYIFLGLIALAFLIYPFSKKNRECNSEQCIKFFGIKSEDHVIHLSVLYETTSDRTECKNVNKFAGVVTPKYETEEFTIRSIASQYEIMIPIDKHIDGTCGWKPSGIYKSVTGQHYSHNGGGDSLFSIKKSSNPDQKQLDLYCQKKDTNDGALYYCWEAHVGPIPVISEDTKKIQVNFLTK